MKADDLPAEMLGDGVADIVFLVFRQLDVNQTPQRLAQQVVSHFKADDYFFYAQGVASAMYTILEAVAEDFGSTVESRRGTELLHHAIESCHHAMEIDPWLITNSNWSGILANHRANLAAPISHARFFIGMLIKTLST